VSKDSGFTFLEVLVSVAVMSILLTVLYSAYTSNLEAIQVSRSTGQLSQTARIALDRMTRDLESAFIRVPYANVSASLGMRLVDGSVRDRPADRLDFTTLAHLSFSGRPDGGDLCEVGYTLDEAAEGGGLVLHRRDDGSPDDDFTSGGYREELARRVSGLEIIFQDEQGVEHESWQVETDGMLPELIRIRLQLADESGRELVFITSVHPALAGPKQE